MALLRKRPLYNSGHLDGDSDVMWSVGEKNLATTRDGGALGNCAGTGLVTKITKSR